MGRYVREIAFARPYRAAQVVLNELKFLGYATERVILAEKQWNAALGGRNIRVRLKLLRFGLLDQRCSAHAKNLAGKWHTSLDWSSRGRRFRWWFSFNLPMSLNIPERFLATARNDN